MPEMKSKVDAGLYNQYKQWLRDTYGWFQGLSYQKNDYDTLVKDRYFQSFISQMNLTHRFPEIQQSSAQQKELWGLSPEEMEERFISLDEEPYAPPEGAKWEVIKHDASGLPIQPRWALTPIGEPEIEPIDPNAMTDYQAGQLKLAQDRFAAEQEERTYARSQAKTKELFEGREVANKWQEEQRIIQQLKSFYKAGIVGNLMGGPAMTEGDVVRGEQEQQAQWWDEEHRRELASAPNWVAKQNLQLQKNPYAQEALDDVSGAADLWEKEYNKAVKAEKRIQDPRSSLYNDVNAQTEISNWKESAGRALNAADIRNAQLYAHNYPGGVAREEAPVEKKQTGVEVPQWLPQFVPQLTAGGFIPGTGTTGGKAPTVAPLGGQAFNRLDPSKFQELAGYVQFAGQKPEDWLRTSQVQLPRNPSQGRRWSPAQQRI